MRIIKADFIPNVSEVKRDENIRHQFNKEEHEELEKIVD